MRRCFLFVVVIALALAACQPAAPTENLPQPTDPPTAEATQPPAVTEPPQPTETQPAPTPEPAPTEISGISISGEGVSFVIPEGLASGAELKVLPESTGSDLPYWDIYPTHRQIDLTGYALSDRFHQPRIYIYPIAEYAAMNEGVAATYAQMQALMLSSAGLNTEESFPFLPTFNAAQVFRAHAQRIDFQSGVGLRFITQFDQAAMPITNRTVFYTFQGLTADGKYYVAAVLPVSHPLLAADEAIETQAPEGGVPLPDYNAPDFADQFGEYLASITSLLNSSAPDDFTPTLSQLDALMASLTVE